MILGIISIRQNETRVIDTTLHELFHSDLHQLSHDHKVDFHNARNLIMDFKYLLSVNYHFKSSYMNWCLINR